MVIRQFFCCAANKDPHLLKFIFIPSCYCLTLLKFISANLNLSAGIWKAVSRNMIRSFSNWCISVLCSSRFYNIWRVNNVYKWRTYQKSVVEGCEENVAVGLGKFTELVINCVVRYTIYVSTEAVFCLFALVDLILYSQIELFSLLNTSINFCCFSLKWLFNLW